MENFEFFSPTKIIFGKDTECLAGKEARKYGSRILFHYSCGSVKRTWPYDRVVKSLKEANVKQSVDMGLLDYATTSLSSRPMARRLCIIIRML
jgi:alcohol dehydrogenase YqhD (iron-dependent ADH family)